VRAACRALARRGGGWGAGEAERRRSEGGAKAERRRSEGGAKAEQRRSKGGAKAVPRSAQITDVTVRLMTHVCDGVVVGAVGDVLAGGSLLCRSCVIAIA